MLKELHDRIADAVGASYEIHVVESDGEILVQLVGGPDTPPLEGAFIRRMIGRLKGELSIAKQIRVVRTGKIMEDIVV